MWESQGRNMRYCYEYQSIYHAASYLRAYAELVWRRGRASNDAMRKTVMQVGRDMYFSEESLVANYPAIIAALPVAEGISAQDISETLKSVMRDVGET